MGDDRSNSPPRKQQCGPKKQLTWLLSGANSPIAISLTRQLLERGDKVVAGVPHSSNKDRDPFLTELRVFSDEVKNQANINANFKVLFYDIRYA